jgi:regulator of sirC expression with transglutaminase-like and TPR domain
MPGVLQLRHLRKLLDDDSEVVREAVRRELVGMRRELPEFLEMLDDPLTPEEERVVAGLLEPARRTELEEMWMRWRWLEGEHAQLEEGLSQLSAFLNGWKTQPADLTRCLDLLARQAFDERGRMTAHELAEWLFSPAPDTGVARFRGNTKDYYSPENSNLFWVIETGLGNPISLCCLYRLLGHRFGLDIGGCNFPGHFLARVMHQGRLWLVDCFNRGRFMHAGDVSKHHPAANPSMDDLVQEPATPDGTQLRILRNLDVAFTRLNNFTDRQFMRRLAVKLMDG